MMPPQQDRAVTLAAVLLAAAYLAVWGSGLVELRAAVADLATGSAVFFLLAAAVATGTVSGPVWKLLPSLSLWIGIAGGWSALAFAGVIGASLYRSSRDRHVARSAPRRAPVSTGLKGLCLFGFAAAVSLAAHGLVDGASLQ